MSRSGPGKGRAVFNQALDPALLLPLRDVRKDKGKSRAYNDGPGGNNGSNRGRARKPLSRINSLVLSTDSPKYVRMLPTTTEGEGSTSAIKSDYTESTITSFDSRSMANMVVIKEVLEAEKEQEALQESRTKEKRLIDNIERRTTYATKRARLSRESGLAATKTTSLFGFSTAVQTAEGSTPKGSNDADDEWNNIWQRWESQSNLTLLDKQNVKSIQAISIPEESVEESQKLVSSSQLSISSGDGRFESQWTIQHQNGIATVPHLSSPDEETMISAAEDANTSRSRVDEGLLNNSASIDDENEEDEVQHRIQMLCQESSGEMRAVQHIIFRGDSVKAHFSPAWDGFQLSRSPPSKAEVAEWCAKWEGEGELYEYRDNLDSVQPWDEEEAAL